MNTIIINTSAYLNEIYILVHKNKIIYDICEIAQFNEYEVLTTWMKKSIDNNTLNNISKIICVIGPGSFTGIRVGATIANTIAFIKKIPVYNLNAFEYFYQTTGYHTLIDAGKDEFYSCKNIDNNFCTDIDIIPISQAIEKFKNRKILLFAKDIIKAKISSDIQIIDYINTQKDLSNIKIKDPKITATPLYIRSASVTMPKH